MVRAGYVVLAHGRDPGRTERLVAELRTEGEAHGFVADLASPARVRELGERSEMGVPPDGVWGKVAAAHPRLDVLINNAGVGFGSPGGGREESADGHELRLAVNYLAPVALTRALLPVLRASAPARIVNVGSAGQQPLDFDDIEVTRDYDGVTAYCRSKLALAAHTFALAEELAGTGVSVNVLHPATYMDTTMVREADVEPWSTVADGAAGVLALATAELGLDATGRYFDGTSPSRAHAQTYDRDVWKRLEAVTDRLLGA